VPCKGDQNFQALRSHESLVDKRAGRGRFRGHLFSHDREHNTCSSASSKIHIKTSHKSELEAIALHNFNNTKMSDEFEVKICCMGAGYVGGPTMAVIAKQCPKVR